MAGLFPLTTRVKRSANSLLRRRGTALVADWELDEYARGRHFGKVLDAYDIDCVIDVGANLGQFHDFAVKYGWHGPIISFEPVWEYYDTISKRASSDLRWQCYRYALGNKNGTAEITVFNSPGLASLRKYVHVPENLQATRTEAIEIRRLPDVWDKVPLFAKRILLKTDTQGYDLEVFRGAQDVLEHISVIWGEVCMRAACHDAPGFSEALEEYSRAGFEVSAMFPVINWDKNLRCNEFDCVLVKTP